jgi:hypothetical protein
MSNPKMGLWSAPDKKSSKISNILLKTCAKQKKNQKYSF